MSAAQLVTSYENIFSFRTQDTWRFLSSITSNLALNQQMSLQGNSKGKLAKALTKPEKAALSVADQVLQKFRRLHHYFKFSFTHHRSNLYCETVNGSLYQL